MKPNKSILRDESEKCNHYHNQTIINVYIFSSFHFEAELESLELEKLRRANNKS